MQLDVDVKGYKATIQRIRDGITDGMDATVEDLLDDAEDDAQDVLSETRRIWRREVYHGFEQSSQTYEMGASGRLANMAPHATVVERGATYGARGPPIEALLPWVASHFGSGGSDPIDRSGDGDDGDSGSGGAGGWGHHAVGGPAQTAEDISNKGAEEDWQFYNITEGFAREDVYASRDVVVYNRDRDRYESGFITRVTRHDTVEVYLGEFDKTVKIGDSPNTTDKRGIVAGEAFENLTRSEKDDVIQQTFDNVERGGDLNQIALDDIDQVFGEYIDLIDDDHVLLNMAHGIEGVYHADNTKAQGTGHNPHITPPVEDHVEVGLLNPSDPDLQKRGTSEGRRAVRHEFGHALAATNGFHYSEAARGGDQFDSIPDDWDMVAYWKNNAHSVGYDYASQGGPGEFHFDFNNADEFPHPVAYFLTDADHRAATAKDELVDYDPYEAWVDHVYYDVLKDGSLDAGEPKFQGYSPDVVFHEKFGEAMPGGRLKVYFSATDEETDIAVKSEVEIHPAEDFDDEYFDITSEHRGVVAEMGNSELLIPVDDNGITSDSMDYVDYAGPSDVETPDWDPEQVSVPGDPGFQNPADSFEAFTEGINRAFFRNAVASEVMDDRDYRDKLYTRPYGVTNGQEATAALFEVLLGRQEDTKQSIENADVLFYEHPDLLYVITQNFTVPDRFKTYLENETGLTWDEILRDIDPNHTVP